MLFHFQGGSIMKKIIIAFLLLASIHATAFSISLNELKNAPEQYVMVKENQSYATYVDPNSIQSLRYSPPYYTLKGDTYIVSYADGSINKCKTIFNYDYDKSSKELIKQIRRQYGNLSGKPLYDKMWEVVEVDSGITGSEIENSCVYKFDGTLITRCPAQREVKIPIMSPLSFAANYIFYRCYNEYFF